MKPTLLLAVLLLLLMSHAVMAAEKGETKPELRAGANVMTACPKSGAEAIVNVDRSLARGAGVAERVTLLCLAEVVKDLQARVKALESGGAKAR